MEGRDELIGDYLARLDAATAALPPDVREDLRTDVRGHLAELAGAGASEASVRDAIDRLGPPERMAADAMAPVLAAAPSSPPAQPSGTAVAARPRPSSARDVATVLSLLLLPLMLLFVFSWIGLIVGVVVGWTLLWTSTSWTGGEKVLATAVWPGGLLLPLVLPLLATQTCVTVDAVTDAGGGVIADASMACTGVAMAPMVGIPVGLLVLVAPVVVGVVLLRRAAARRNA